MQQNNIGGGDHRNFRQDFHDNNAIKQLNQEFGGQNKNQVYQMFDNQPISNLDGYEQVIQEKDNTITQLRETVEILELKIKKLEQLVKLKDSKISNLTNKLRS